ncbi:hypothetical protein ABPG72_014491 [Tetrahymena utriculariae]
MCIQDLCEKIKCCAEISEKIGIFRKIFQVIILTSSIVLIVYLILQFKETIIPVYEYYQQYDMRKCDGESGESCYYFSNQELSEQQIISENCDKLNDPEEYSQDTQNDQKIKASVLFGISEASLLIKIFIDGRKFFSKQKCQSKILDFFLVFGNFCYMLLTYFAFYISIYDPSDKCIKKRNWTTLQLSAILQFQRSLGMVNISDPAISQTFVYVVDQNLNVYQQSLYQDQGKLILQGQSMANNFPLSTKVCQNVKNNILFYPQNNYVYKRKNNQDFQVEVDSYRRNFNLLFDQNLSLTFLSQKRSNYSIYFLDSNLNNSVLLFSTSNIINDYGLLKYNTLIACGSNSLIYFGNYQVNPLNQGIDTNDYDYKNIQPSLNQSQLNYTRLVIGNNCTVFYGSQSVITVLLNKKSNCTTSQILPIIEGSLLKAISSSGLLFLEMTNGQLKKHTSCFRALSVYEEKIVGLYFYDELFRKNALENQGKLGYFGYPKGEYLTQYYNISQNSAWTYNKLIDKINFIQQYIFQNQNILISKSRLDIHLGNWVPLNFVVVTSYLNGSYLGKLQFNDSFTANNVYYDNNLEIILVVDTTQSLNAFNLQNFVQAYKQATDNNIAQIFQSQLGQLLSNQNQQQDHFQQPRSSYSLLYPILRYGFSSIKNFISKIFSLVVASIGHKFLGRSSVSILPFQIISSIQDIFQLLFICISYHNLHNPHQIFLYGIFIYLNLREKWRQSAEGSIELTNILSSSFLKCRQSAEGSVELTNILSSSFFVVQDGTAAINNDNKPNAQKMCQYYGGHHFGRLNTKKRISTRVETTWENTKFHFKCFTL